MTLPPTSEGGPSWGPQGFLPTLSSAGAGAQRHERLGQWSARALALQSDFSVCVFRLVFSLELTDAQFATHKVPLLFGAGLWSLAPPHRLGLQPTLSGNSGSNLDRSQGCWDPVRCSPGLSCWPLASKQARTPLMRSVVPRAGSGSWIGSWAHFSSAAALGVGRGIGEVGCLVRWPVAKGAGGNQLGVTPAHQGPQLGGQAD